MAFREWLNSWTFFNWLTLIAFTMATMLFLPSAISHWLNLYPKFKNWRATKSKEKFEWRIKELEMQIYKASKYKNAPKIFFIELLDDAIHPLSALLFAFLLFLFACLVLSNSIQSNFVAVYQLTATILSFCSYALVLFCIRFFRKLTRLTENIRFPLLGALEYINFLKEGREKFFISLEEVENKIDDISKMDIFDEYDKKALLKKVDSLQLKP